MAGRGYSFCVRCSKNKFIFNEYGEVIEEKCSLDDDEPCGWLYEALGGSGSD